jgi:hypothetical protein
MAGFALDAGLRGLDALFGGEAELAGGVALEAAEDLRAGVEDAILDTVGRGVARGERFDIGIRILGESVFEVVVGVEARDGCGGLAAGAEQPEVVAAGEGIRMGRAFLRGPLGLVTFGTGRRPGELGGGR